MRMSKTGCSRTIAVWAWMIPARSAFTGWPFPPHWAAGGTAPAGRWKTRRCGWANAETERTAHALAAKIEASYLPVFFDPARGYLHAVVDPNTHRGTGVYQNVSTAAMDYPFGEYLLHDTCPSLRPTRLMRFTTRRAAVRWPSMTKRTRCGRTC